MIHEELSALVFATPLPRKYTPFLSVLFPFDLWVWTGILVCIGVVALVTFITTAATEQGPLMSKFAESLWWTYAIIIGENVNIDIGPTISET